MRKFRAFAAFLLAGAATTAGVVWRLWPRPLAACIIPEAIPDGADTRPRVWTKCGPDPNPFTPAGVGLFDPGDPGGGDWVFIRSAGPADRVWAFDAATGRLVGPAAAERQFEGSPAAVPGRLLLPESPAFGREGAVRVGAFDLSTGRTEVRFERRVGRFVGMDFAGHRTVAALVTGGTDAPLAVEAVDLDTGASRCRLVFPGRFGSVESHPFAHADPDDRRVAASGVALSPDGEILAVGEAWDGAGLVTPPGIGLYGTRTGELLRRVPPHGSEAHRLLPFATPGGRFAESAATGAWDIGFSPDGRRLTWHAARRFRQGTDGRWERGRAGDRRSIDTATDAPVPPGPTRHSDWGQNYPRAFDPVSGRALFVMHPDDPGQTRVRVTDEDGAPVCDWLPLPAGASRRTPFDAGVAAVGSAGAALRIMQDREPGVAARLAARLGLAPPPPQSTGVFWLDPTAGTIRPIRSFPGVDWDVHIAVRANSVAVLALDRATNTVALELWPLPPRDPWSAAILAGTLAAWRFGRRRKRVETPPPALPGVG